MTQLNRCVMCDHKGALDVTTSSERVQVGRVCFDGKLPAFRCPGCGETYIDGAIIRKFELLIAEQLADNGQRSPDAFRFMRKALGMRAIDLAQFIGVGAETVSRYENGAREIDPIRFGVLAILVADKLAGRDEAQARFLAAQRPFCAMPQKVVLEVA